MTRPEFYKGEQSRKHFEARLICLNKKFPKTPQLVEYRPIVVTSPVVKFLEGAIMAHLRKYAL